MHRSKWTPDDVNNKEEQHLYMIAQSQQLMQPGLSGKKSNCIMNTLLVEFELCWYSLDGWAVMGHLDLSALCMVPFSLAKSADYIR